MSAHLIPSEEHTERTDSSNDDLFEALSGDEDLKRQISEEVNEEFRREELLQDIIDNSKEVQYSVQGSNKDEPVETFRIKSVSPKTKSPSSIDKHKAVPLTMAYMERIMTKLQASASSLSRRVPSKDRGIQT